jgi:hypothetical protein
MDEARFSKQVDLQIIRKMRCGTTEENMDRVIYDAGIFCCLIHGVKGKKNIW